LDVKIVILEGDEHEIHLDFKQCSGFWKCWILLLF